MPFFSVLNVNLPQRNFAFVANNQSALNVGTNIGDVLFLGGTTGRIYRFKENNGTFLTSSGLPGATVQAIEAFGSRLVVFVQNQGFYTSDDFGDTFTLRQAAAVSIAGMATNGSVIVAQQTLSSTGWASVNGGLTWASSTNIGDATNNNCNQYLRYYRDKNLFVRVGLTGRIALSVTGVFDSFVATGLANTIISQAFFNNYLYVGTTGGQIARSQNLSTFEVIPADRMYYNPASGTGIPQFTNLFVYNRNLYATTSQGGVMYSENGIDFFPCTSPLSSSIPGYATDGKDLILTGGTSNSVIRNLTV